MVSVWSEVSSSTPIEVATSTEVATITSGPQATSSNGLRLPGRVWMRRQLWGLRAAGDRSGDQRRQAYPGLWRIATCADDPQSRPLPGAPQRTVCGTGSRSLLACADHCLRDVVGPHQTGAPQQDSY